MKEKIIRSPFFYVGDKYRLMPQLRKLFPQKISTYIEPFVGGGSSFINTSAERYIVNDINFYVVALHEMMKAYAGRPDKLFQKLYDLISRYGLSCSLKNFYVPDELKKNTRKHITHVTTKPLTYNCAKNLTKIGIY